LLFVVQANKKLIKQMDKNCFMALILCKKEFYFVQGICNLMVFQ
jgi:uncharacterized pyridoxamine 5'-phosphate oxidase family protein